MTTNYSQLITTTDANNNISASAITFAGKVTGANNVAIGNGAAAGVTTTASGVFLGAGANVSTDGLTNVTAIGKDATVGESNSVVLGKDCNVGISTSSPTYGLHLGTPANGVTWYKPQIYVASSSAVTAPTNANDGVISVDGGALKFTTSAGTYTVLSTAMATGNDTLTSGTEGNPASKTIIGLSAGSITATSRIIVSRKATSSLGVTTVGALYAIPNVTNNTFTVYSTVSDDAGNFDWMIINDTNN